MKTYEKQWKKIEDLITKKKLPKTALTEVKKIYALAKKEKQDAQLVKAVVYMTGLQRETREDNEILSIKEMEKEIATAKEPVVSIFRSLLAGVYLNYFQKNRWQLYHRTETIQFRKEDISTWTATDFHRQISDLYLQSIKNEKLLQQTKLEPFDAIIIKGNVRHLRPTLYDLLTHRALEYFKSDERDINKPAYAFEIGQAGAFDPAVDFIQRKFITRDSLSLQHKALLIYQQLIAFHLKDKKPGPLLDADIERLEFVHENSTHPDKDSLYRAALEHLVSQYKDLPVASQAWYLLAREYNSDADSYEPFGDTTKRYARVKAKEICERVINQKDSSEGKVNCINLLNQITAKELKFSLEKVNVPNKPFRSLIQYKNLDKVFLRLVKADEKTADIFNYYDDKAWLQLLGMPAVRNWEQSLPDTKDYQTHSVEIKIDELPGGEYILLAASDNFSKEAVIGARIFYVSNISFVNNENDYFLLHRETGKPLSDASVQIWEQLYDPKQSKYIKQKGAVYKTSANGFFKLNRPSKEIYNYNYVLDITHNSDKLFMNEWTNDTYYRNPDRKEIEPIEERRIFFFTDRSIYRPGQTIFFKGIAIIPDKETKNKVLADYSTWIYLRNANYQLTDSVQVRTNEYGSFSGKFQTPVGVLNGNFSLYAKDQKGETDFSVEEYKRPKFYVDFEKIKGTFKVNDKIKITGIAKAYAGNNIDGAVVKYRVVRRPRFPYPWLLWRWWQPPTPPMEITHGEVKTDKDGKFILEFEAIPDKTIDKKLDPVFDYSITADVTDINGETRSGESSVSVGYKSLILSVNLPPSLPVDSLDKISIRTENMAGEFEPSKVNVTISGLKEEKRLIRQRYWERPDQFVMSKEEYIKNFPFDEYDNETDHQSWAKAQKVYERSDSIAEHSTFNIQHSTFSSGWYAIEISTKDKNGEEVKDIKYVQLVDDKNNQLGSPQYLWTQGSKTIEPGEKTEIKIGSSANDVFVIKNVARSHDSRLTTHDYVFESLDNEKKSFEFVATEADRGGYVVNFIFVKHNRLYQYSNGINIPWTNKDLNIEYATFRDKTLPGSEEKWKIKITGYKKEMVASEILGSMYDASLDQFRFHSWNEPNIWPHYYHSSPWKSDHNFSQFESQEKPVNALDEKKSVQKWYDELISDINEAVIHYDDVNKRYYKIGVVVKDEGIRMAAPASDISAAEKKSEDLQEVVVVDQKPIKLPEQIKIRKNFNETAFFLPDLRTNENGDIEFSFTMPEALTKWKFQALAHTKDLAFGYSSKEIITQKELMVQPNPPRFLREGDKIEFSTKIVNLTGKELTGQAELQLFDAATNESVSGWFSNMFPNQYFTVAAGQSEAITFPLQVPFLFDKALVWRMVARAGDVSDGEESAMPVLTNRMLVTETFPLNVRGQQTKNFRFEKLLTSGGSETLQHQILTIEYTSNPVWYAIQALPYLMEFPYECAEQVWNRYYANALASKIANSSPRIKQIFESWNRKDTAALLSNLQKNQELKAVLLEETPWVLQAKTEEQQKKNIALLFDMFRMSSEMTSSYEKLKQMQLENGGFVWFKGGPDNRYITQYIVTGIGHLKKLGVDIKKLEPILKLAIPYLDLQVKKGYDDLKKSKTDLAKYTPGHYEIQYLYMRSFFADQRIPLASEEAYKYFRTRAQQTWTKQSKYMQGMIGLALFRTSDTKTPAAILRSLKETSISNEESGMYWKENSGGWFWHQAPVETQALLIEAFSEIARDTKTVDDLKTWLLKNKQTNNWRTTKATAEACYALLLQGTDLLINESIVEIKLGNTMISPTDEKQEAGTGYFKKTINGPLVSPDMGNISVKVESTKFPLQGDLGGWGAVYWQYFEDLDKITTASTPLRLNKKLFVETNTDHGPVLTPINEGEAVKVGDK
ncbi:MAG TPA: alpha-2-macroglobulin family protein, partial [Chitinophagaceae bacterium]|nr:alpha-2-macroglobulin family protein [Chitinophagaceae bacterium]